MVYYSNNYSKYIEDLKAEKSKKTFQELVKNSREVKSEKILFTENYSDKEKINTPYIEEVSNKTYDKLNYEGSRSYKTGKIVNSEVAYNDYSDSEKITSVEFRPEEKENIEFENVNSGSIKASSNINYQEELSKKNGSEISNVTNSSSKNKRELSFEREESNKEDSELVLENEESKKLLSDISKENAFSERVKSSLNKEYVFSGKSDNELIFDIIEEKKKKKLFSQDLVSEPKKNSPYNLSKAYKYFTYRTYDSGRKYEETRYAKEANTYNYYPAGSYSEIDTIQTNAINDIFSTVTNSKNWSSTSNVIVSSIKVASDLIDAINIVGPSENIYREGITENKIRYDLKLSNEKFGEKKQHLVYGKYDYEKYKNMPVFDMANRNLSEKTEGELGVSIENNEKDDSAVVKSEKGKTEFTEDGSRKTDPLNDRKNLSSETNEKTEKKLKEFTESFSDKQQDVIIKGKIEDGKGDYLDLTEDGGVVADPIKTEDEIAFETKSTERAATSTFKFGNKNYTYDVKDGRDFELPNNIGKIYVIPPYNQLAKTTYNSSSNVAFTIPLQNNIQIEQISRAASYNAISFFGRIGDVQQYSKTGSLDAINITTKYFVEGNETNDDFNMAKLQDIEMKYRSLVLPAESSADYLEDNDKSKFYYFTRPPVINVVLGKTNDNKNLPTLESDAVKDKNKVYKNFFTDIITTSLSSDTNPYSHEIYYKNFVVTNVSIDKNDNDYNYYIELSDKNSYDDYYDKMGFSVTLTLLEVDENYLGSLPSFNNYYNTIQQRS